MPEAFEKPVGVAIESTAAPGEESRGVDHLTVDIELELGMGAVAYANGAGVPVAVQVG